MRSTRTAALLRSALLGTILCAATAGVAWARCLPSDFEDAEAAEDAIVASCDCEAAQSHDQYVACVEGVLAELSLRPRCAAQVRRWYRKSTCGRAAEAVRCCMPAEPGPGCRIARSAQRCAELGGTPSSSPGDTCADACAPADPCSVDEFPTCGGECPRGGVCQAVQMIGAVQQALCVCASASDACPGPDPRCGAQGVAPEVLDCSCPGGATHTVFTGAYGSAECSCTD